MCLCLFSTFSPSFGLGATCVRNHAGEFQLLRVVGEEAADSHRMRAGPSVRGQRLGSPTQAHIHSLVGLHKLLLPLEQGPMARRSSAPTPGQDAHSGSPVGILIGHDHVSCDPDRWKPHGNEIRSDVTGPALPRSGQRQATGSRKPSRGSLCGLQSKNAEERNNANPANRGRGILCFGINDFCIALRSTSTQAYTYF